MRVWTGFEGKSRLYDDPESIVLAGTPADVAPGFDRLERALARGRHIAGFFSFESGYTLEPRLGLTRPVDFPLFQFGVYRAPRRGRLLPARRAGALQGFHLNLSRAEYDRNVERIRSFIAQGDVYQITYCIKMGFGHRGDSRSLFQTLLAEQPVPYPALIETDGFHILSLSPELFLKKKGTRLISQPMKGTWPRGAGWWKDTAARFRLKFDPKNRAENVMIADLLRNDLGRIGSRVRAPTLFEVTGYKTLYQMTSTVRADVPRGIPLRDLFRAVFPSGSVTGAPKMRAMEILRELEGEDRRIYTGAIGYVTPDRDLCFNIPIRTLLLRDGRGEMGIGGGIVWDSTPAGEWAEGLLKARFLTDSALAATAAVSF